MDKVHGQRTSSEVAMDEAKLNVIKFEEETAYVQRPLS